MKLMKKKQMKNKMANKIIILFAILIVGCSPEKRLARLIRNHPELVKHDTIWKRDTTIVYGVQHDTVLRNTITRDTVVIKDKQLTIKYFNNGEKIYLSGKCDTVTIIKEIPIATNTINVEQKTRFYDEIKRLFWVLLIAGIILFCVDRYFLRGR